MLWSSYRQCRGTNTDKSSLLENPTGAPKTSVLAFKTRRTCTSHPKAQMFRATQKLPKWTSDKSSSSIHGASACKNHLPTKQPRKKKKSKPNLFKLVQRLAGIQLLNHTYTCLHLSEFRSSLSLFSTLLSSTVAAAPLPGEVPGAPIHSRCIKLLRDPQYNSES